MNTETKIRETSKEWVVSVRTARVAPCDKQRPHQGNGLGRDICYMIFQAGNPPFHLNLNLQHLTVLSHSTIQSDFYTPRDGYLYRDVYPDRHHVCLSHASC